MALHLNEVGVENNINATVVLIIVDSGDVINGDFAELSDNGHVAGDFGVGRDLDFGIALKDPFYKDLAGHKGILGQGADGFTAAAEILFKAFRHVAFIVEHDKVDGVLRLESSRYGEVAGDGFTAIDLVFSDIPAGELLSFDHGVGGQLESASGIICIRLVNLSVNHEVDREHLLGILGPNLGILGDLDGVVKIAAGIDPLAGITGLGGNQRNVVEAIGRVDIDGLSGIGLGVVLVLIEGDGVGDLGKIGDDGGVLIGNIVSVDAPANGADLRSLFAFHDGAQSPVGVVVLTRDGWRHLIADGFTLYHIDCRMHIRIAIVEGDRPGLRRLVALVPFPIAGLAAAGEQAIVVAGRITGAGAGGVNSAGGVAIVIAGRIAGAGGVADDSAAVAGRIAGAGGVADDSAAVAGRIAGAGGVAGGVKGGQGHGDDLILRLGVGADRQHWEGRTLNGVKALAGDAVPITAGKKHPGPGANGRHTDVGAGGVRLRAVNGNNRLLGGFGRFYVKDDLHRRIAVGSAFALLAIAAVARLVAGAGRIADDVVAVAGRIAGAGGVADDVVAVAVRIAGAGGVATNDIIAVAGRIAGAGGVATDDIIAVAGRIAGNIGITALLNSVGRGSIPHVNRGGIPVCGLRHSGFGAGFTLRKRGHRAQRQYHKDCEEHGYRFFQNS